MSKPDLGKCSICGVTVLARSPDRCLDRRCPTMVAEEKSGRGWRALEAA